jgi:hypothetical protein
MMKGPAGGVRSRSGAHRAGNGSSTRISSSRRSGGESGGGPILEEWTTLEGARLEGVEDCEGGMSSGGGAEWVGRTSRTDLRIMSAFQVLAQKEVRGAMDSSLFMAQTKSLRK